MLRSQKSHLCNLRSLNCGNVTLFKSQTGGLALNRRKRPEMCPEWSPGPENRPPGMPQPFSRLWDRSCGPKPPQRSTKMPVWGLAPGLYTSLYHAELSLQFGQCMGGAMFLRALQKSPQTFASFHVLHNCTIATAAPIGAAGRPNRGGAY